MREKLEWIEAESGKYKFLRYKDEVEIFPETICLDSTKQFAAGIGDIIAILLLEHKIHINNHWWEEDRSEEYKQSFYVGVNCNDVFAWGCADCEEITYKELPDLWEHYKQDPLWGCDVWCIKKRNELPQKPVYKDIMSKGIWDLDSMGLEPNYYDNRSREQTVS